MTKFLQWIIAAVLLVGLTGLYISTRTAVHTFDALSYTQDIETKPVGLLYGPTGYVAVQIAKAVNRPRRC
jgi:uncharacterized membrane protein